MHQIKIKSLGVMYIGNFKGILWRASSKIIVIGALVI